MNALIAIAVLLAWSAGGAAWVVLRVRRHPSWHPGDDLPDVPAGSPLRTWRQ